MTPSKVISWSARPPVGTLERDLDQLAVVAVEDQLDAPSPSSSRDRHLGRELVVLRPAHRGSRRNSQTRSARRAPRAAPPPRPRVRSRLGMTSSGSNSCTMPRPVQAGQAPCGELNEKLRGSISPDAEAAVRAGEVLGEGQSPPASVSGSVGTVATLMIAVAELQRRLDRVEQAGAIGIGLVAVNLLVGAVLADDEAVDDDLDGVLLVFRQLRHLVQLVDGAIDAHADEARAARILDQPQVLALALADERRRGSSAGCPRAWLAACSTICCGDCCAIGAPQFGQWGWPMRAKRRRR